MNKHANLEKTCAVTKKGQTTLPLSIRQILGIEEGGRILVRAEGRRITIEAVQDPVRDPAIGSFLRLIADDVASARHVGGLAPELLSGLESVLQDVDSDLDDAIEGDVCL